MVTMARHFHENGGQFANIDDFSNVIQFAYNSIHSTYNYKIYKSIYAGFLLYVK